MSEYIWYLSFRVWVTSLNMLFSISIHLPADFKISLCFFFCVVLHSSVERHLGCSLSCSWFQWNHFEFLSISLMLAVGLLYVAFIKFRFVPCIPALSKIMKRCCILSKAFSTSNEMIMWFLFFSLFIWWITLTDFCTLNHPCISGLKPIWSWWMMVLMCSWIQFASILFSIFASMFMSEIGL